MKVLMISSEFPPVVGGIASHVHELSRALVKKGLEVTVISRLLGSAASTEILDGIRVIRPKMFGQRWLYAWQLRRQINTLLKQESFDLIHAHGIRPLMSLRGTGLPICFTNHSSGFLKRLHASDRKKRFTLQQLELCDVILSPSRELDEATSTMGYKGTRLYIPNGVDIKKFSPGESQLRQSLEIPDKAIVLVLSRRLVEKNGVLFFAQALAGIKHENVYALIAGDGVLRPEFELILRESPIWPRTRMLGYVPNRDMVGVYRASDIAILPSLMEATSISGLEAMATGLPIIGTRVGGIPELVQSGENGFLVPPADATALRSAIQSAIADPSALKTMGQNSLNKARDHYSWETIAEQVMKVYQSLV